MANKVAPQTATQRQKSFRQAKTEDGFIEVRMWFDKRTFEKIKAKAIAEGITQGEVIDQLMNN
tara:strand:+ start:342 stop:530 length:189 start_codon:yes stop_codon:yes gene_type:complete